jgi:exonuclease III
MIILSINVKGLGSHPKILLLVILVEIHRPDILLIQETMGMVKKCSRTSSFVKGLGFYVY